jgi:hypothetical protein
MITVKYQADCDFGSCGISYRRMRDRDIPNIEVFRALMRKDGWIIGHGYTTYCDDVCEARAEAKRDANETG